MLYVWTLVPDEIQAVRKQYNQLTHVNELIMYTEVPKWNGIKYVDGVYTIIPMNKEYLTKHGMTVLNGNSLEMRQTVTRDLIKQSWEDYCKTDLYTAKTYGLYLKDEYGIVIEDSLSTSNDNDLYEKLITTIKE